MCLWTAVQHIKFRKKTYRFYKNMITAKKFLSRLYSHFKGIITNSRYISTSQGLYQLVVIYKYAMFISNLNVSINYLALLFISNSYPFFLLLFSFLILIYLQVNKMSKKIIVQKMH